MPQFPSYLQRVNSDSKTARSSYFLLFPSIPTVITRSQEEGNHQAKAITHISIASRPRGTEQKAALPDPFSPHSTDTVIQQQVELPQAQRHPYPSTGMMHFLLQPPRDPTFHHTSPCNPCRQLCISQLRPRATEPSPHSLSLHTLLPQPHSLVGNRSKAEEERCSSGFSLWVVEQADTHEEALPRLPSLTCFWETLFWVFLFVAL